MLCCIATVVVVGVLVKDTEHRPAEPCTCGAPGTYTTVLCMSWLSCPICLEAPGLVMGDDCCWSWHSMARKPTACACAHILGVYASGPLRCAGADGGHGGGAGERAGHVPVAGRADAAPQPGGCQDRRPPAGTRLGPGRARPQGARQAHVATWASQHTWTAALQGFKPAGNRVYGKSSLVHRARRASASARWRAHA